MKKIDLGARRAFLVTCGVGLSSLVLGNGCVGDANSPSAGGLAPDFTVDTLTAETFRLSDHLGKRVIVIDFWTTFCVPCLPALAHLEEFYEKYKAQGLIVLGVSMDPSDTAGNVPSFVRAHKLTFPVAHDTNSRVTDLYNKKSSAPYQVLIGRDGKILKQRDVYQPGDEVGMEADIKAALAAKLPRHVSQLTHGRIARWLAFALAIARVVHPCACCVWSRVSRFGRGSRATAAASASAR